MSLRELNGTEALASRFCSEVSRCRDSDGLRQWGGVAEGRRHKMYCRCPPTIFAWIGGHLFVPGHKDWWREAWDLWFLRIKTHPKLIVL